MGREYKICSQVVVVKGVSIQGFGAIVCVVSLAIMHALAKRLQNYLI